MKEKKLEVITCPHCGTEYLPAEIYLPNEFLGKPSHIEKIAMTGKINSFVGQSMNLTEHFICDCCNTPFVINAKVQFFTKEDTKNNFNKEYSTPLKKENLFLKED